MKLNLSPSNNNVNVIDMFKAYNNQYISLLLLNIYIIDRSQLNYSDFSAFLVNKKILDDNRDIKEFLNQLFRGIDVNYSEVIKYFYICFYIIFNSPNDFDRLVNIMSLDEGIIAHKLSIIYIDISFIHLIVNWRSKGEMQYFLDLCNSKLGNKNDITIEKFFFFFQIPPLSISEMIWLCNYFDASKKGFVYLFIIYIFLFCFLFFLG